MIRRLAMTGGGLGYAPIASGTFGSAGAVAVGVAWWALHGSAGLDPVWLDAGWILLTLLASAGCVAWGPWAVEAFAETARKKGDPGEVVIDEFAGQWISLVALPMDDWRQMLAVMVTQFFLFRIFDIIKPPPGRRLEKCPAGWGILLDDLAAGVYANVIGQILFRLVLPQTGLM